MKTYDEQVNKKFNVQDEKQLWKTKLLVICTKYNSEVWKGWRRGLVVRNTTHKFDLHKNISTLSKTFVPHLLNHSQSKQSVVELQWKKDIVDWKFGLDPNFSNRHMAEDTGNTFTEKIDFRSLTFTSEVSKCTHLNFTEVSIIVTKTFWKKMD